MSTGLPIPDFRTGKYKKKSIHILHSKHICFDFKTYMLCKRNIYVLKSEDCKTKTRGCAGSPSFMEQRWHTPLLSFKITTYG